MVTVLSLDGLLYEQNSLSEQHLALFQTFQLGFGLGAESVGYRMSTTNLGLGIFVHLKLSQGSLDEPEFISEHCGILVIDLFVS